ncbi:hypothetical protein V3N99_22150 (plasmid) [Dermatophilaceae bacterium Soc4.6]
MFDHDRDFPRAYTVPGIAHKDASTRGVQWALKQAQALGSTVSLYAPGKQNLRRVAEEHPAVHALIQRGVQVTTWRNASPGGGVVVALWPDEKHLLAADESGSTRALVAVTWNARETLEWARAKDAEPLGGPSPDISPTAPLDPVVAAAVDGLGILVGQHKTADQRYRAAMAKGLAMLRDAGYVLDPSAVHTHAIGHGWRASNAEQLREVTTRINEGRVIKGMKSAPLQDDALVNWRQRAAQGSAPDEG